MEVLGWRSDAELVDGVRRGEDFAFGRLFERWFGRVLGVAQDILGDPQAAAEVATDTFHALWYHLDRLEDPEGFGAWAVETSRTFAQERLGTPADREEATPLPILAAAPDAAAAVAIALVARGLPSAAGLGQALPSAAGAIGSPFGPAAAGFAGSAPGPAGFAGAVPPAGSPMGFAGATLPAPPQTPPAGFAGGAPASGFAGTPGSGSILGGPAGQAADMATQAMPSLGAFGPPDDTSMPRVHRYEPPPRGGMLRSPQTLAGIAAVIVLVVVGALLLTRGDSSTTAADAATTTVPPAAPVVSAPTSAPTTTVATTASTTSESSTTSTTAASSTSTTRKATTSTTKASTTSTATTRATTTATSASTTASTTATTSATTPTTAATTSSSQVTRTTPTSSSTSSSSSSSSSSTVPKPVIDSFTLVVNTDVVCAVGTAQKGYTAAWSASNATTSALTVGTDAPIRVASGKGSRNFCAVKGTAVQVAVSGAGGKDSATKNTP